MFVSLTLSLFQACQKPLIGMRVKLAPGVPTFIRELTEPVKEYRRPPPLIGTILKVVGDPLEQKRNHSFKYRSCYHTLGVNYPIAMWCDVRWDAPAGGQEVSITGYHTGRFGMMYLWMVDEEEDPMNDPRNIALREDKAKQLALQAAVAKRLRDRALIFPEIKGASQTQGPGVQQSRPESANGSGGSRTPGTGFTPRYWADSQARLQRETNNPF